MLSSILVIFLTTAVKYCSAEKLVRFDLSLKLTDMARYPQPVVKLEADGQSMYALVDTGAPFLFFVWKQWYESNLEKCGDLFFGCYECNPPCKQGTLTAMEFGDGSEVWLFPHSGKLNIGGVADTALDFGLVAGTNEEPVTVWASFGLRRSTDDIKPYKSIIDQLHDKKVTSSRGFSVYLNNRDDPTGEILLGGVDPKKYVKPLQYVDIIDEDRGTVQLLTLGIGQDPNYRIKMVTPADLDTGASKTFLHTKWKKQVIHFLQVAGRKNVTITEADEYLSISCPDAAYLPPLTFFLQGSNGGQVALKVPAANFVFKTTEGTCIIRIAFADGDASIGVTAFVGNYFYYDVDNKKIGIAKVKEGR